MQNDTCNSCNSSNIDYFGGGDPDQSGYVQARCGTGDPAR